METVSTGELVSEAHKPDLSQPSDESKPAHVADIVKDPATGRIIKSELSSAAASALAQFRHSKEDVRERKARELLKADGYEWDAAPPELRQLALQACGERAGNVQALRLYLQQCGKLRDSKQPISAGETVRVMVSGDAAMRVAQILREERGKVV